MSDPTKAVFLSYASQDADAAKRICNALRAAGVEVWFDQSELVGGDQWDVKIRGQIAACALFVPVISANTQARLEGYFRLEWKLAAQRMHTMADEKTFLLPVVIDATRDADAKVPAEFKTVQWTRLPGGETNTAFCARVKKLLGGEEVARAFEHVRSENAGLNARATAKAGRRIPVAALVGGAVLLAVAGVMVLAPWRPGAQSAAGVAPIASNSPSAAIAPLAEARQLASKARRLFENRSDTADDCALAEDYCKQALKLAPDESDVWAVYSQLSSLTYLHGYDQSPARLELARTQADRALKLQPRSTEARFSKATVLRLLGEASLGEAEKMLRELSIEMPDDSRVWISLGKVICRSNAGLNGIRKNLVRADEAFACFDSAAAIPAGRAEGLCERGALLYQLGRFDEAEAATDESLRLEPVIRVVANKAGLAIRRGDFAAAQAALKRLPDEVRQDDDVVLTMAWVWLCSGMSDRCLDVLNSFPRDYLSGNPFRMPTDSMRGYAYEVAGKAAAAHSARQTALQVVEHRLITQPHDAALLLEHANLLGLLGDREKARAALKLYDETYPGPYFNESWEGWVIAAHATVDSPDATIDRLEVLYGDQHSADLQATYLFPMLRDHPRFKALLAKLAPMPNAKVASEALPVVDAKSVAVLAFADLSPAHDSEYFSDGISEELINALGKVPGLKVPARTSSFYFKSKNVPVPDIAKQLGVAYVIEGSVQRAGDKVKISARLSKAADGFQVWTDSFLRDAKDVFAVEEEIAGLIAKQLSLKLGVSSAAARASVNPQAFELYVQARQAWSLRTPAGFDLAENELNRALALEPNFARAYAALADVGTQRLVLPRTTSEAEDQSRLAEQTRIRAKITQALTLDPDSVEAHASLGNMLLQVGQSSEAEPALRRAVALNPNYASAHQWLGRVLMHLGYASEALEHSRLATELDPLSPVIWWNYGSGLRYSGRLADAMIALDRALVLQPNFNFALKEKSFALVELGRLTEAVALVRRLPSDYEAAATTQLVVFAQAGLKAEAGALLAGPGSQANHLGGRLRSLLALGRTEEALALMTPKWINLAGADDYIWNPIYDPVRNDPRWVKLMAEVGLTEAHARAQAWRAAHPPEKPVAKLNI